MSAKLYNATMDVQGKKWPEMYYLNRDGNYRKYGYVTTSNDFSSSVWAKTKQEAEKKWVNENIPF